MFKVGDKVRRIGAPAIKATIIEGHNGGHMARRSDSGKIIVLLSGFWEFDTPTCDDHEWVTIY